MCFAEGRVDTERQLKRHRYSLNSSKVGKHGTVNSGGGGPRSSKKAVAATEAAAPPTADAPTCIICCDAVAGVECRSNAHFCCFGCISATVVTWSDSYPLRIASGVRCPEGGFGSSGCGGTYDPESLRIGLSAAAAGHVTAAHVLAAQLPMKRDAHAAATGANVSMAVELWNGGLRDAAMGRLRRHLCDELLVSRCPKCMLQYAGVRPGDCMALECRMDNAPEGVEVKACGVYICGWCDAMTDTSAEMHKHVHDCPQKVGTQSYWSNANTNEYTNYEESLRRRRAARLADLALTIGDEAYAALRTAAQPVLAMHGL